MDERRDEMAGLVVSFLQQNFKEYPEGLNHHDFIKRFPEQACEPEDWYKQYGHKSVREALSAIQDHVNIKPAYPGGPVLISLNLKSNKIDSDLLHLIAGQRAKPKKKRPAYGRPNRALMSFSMNRQYSSGRPSFSSQNIPHRRLNHDQRGSQWSFGKSSEPTTRLTPQMSSYNRPNNNIASSFDPRSSRYSSSITSSISSPKPTPPQPQPTRPEPAKAAASGGPPTRESTRESTRSPTREKSRESVRDTTQEPIVRRRDKENSIPKTTQQVPSNPEIEKRKVKVRQRLVFLLTRKHCEIKLLFLKGLYKVEFDEELNPIEFGYKSILDLMKDGEISDYIKLNIKSPHITITMKDFTLSKEKRDSDNEATCAETNCNGLTKFEEKVDAIEPFNLRNMSNCLEPFTDLSHSKSKVAMEIDDVIQYKTIRIIIKSKTGILPLDDWELRYEQESMLRIKVRDFGYKSPNEFFDVLATKTPIKTKLSKVNGFDTVVAYCEPEALNSWLGEQLSKGRYRAIMSKDSLYDIVALPTETYTFNNLDNLILADYVPVSILSAKDYNSMWIGLKESKAIEDFLTIDSSMASYKDYKEKKLLAVPTQFIIPGFPCAVYDHSENRWCRGLVLKEPKNKDVEVLLVDYAITKVVAITDLLCLLRTHLTNHPVGPIYSRLIGVDDKNDSVKGRSRMVLQEYTNPPVKLACEVISKVSQPEGTPKYLPRYVAEIGLYDTRRNVDVNLADLINVDQNSP